LITNDKTINRQLLNPVFAHQRSYWVQVEGAITEAAIAQLSKGVSINVDGKLYLTKPAQLEILPDTLEVPERNPPIRFRKSIPTSWVAIQITEGKNRQVRKMFAQVGFPVLRLIRAKLGKYTIETMQPGDCLSLTALEVQEGFFR
jgi:23S rRNA pseudouridine2457 synthase